MKYHQCCQYFGSVVLILLSILIGWIVQTGRTTLLVDLTTQKPLKLRSLTNTERDDYQRDGTVLIRNLLDVSQTKRLKAAIDNTPVLRGGIFDLIKSSLFDQIRFDLWRTDATIASLALQSLPNVVASVNSPSLPRLRLLRDAYFSYESGSRGCGWHVDDEGFWPTLNDTSGVTIWIALDDMTEGGGLMVANRTYDAEFLPNCRQKTRSATCDMERLAPECHEALEKVAIRSWEVKAGDAIVWDRWIFHRTIPVNSTESILRRRYSVRYIPETAKAFGAIHKSIPQEGSFIGSPYYPQVLPTLIDNEMEALRQGLEADFSLLNLLINLGRFLYKYIFDQRIM